MDWLHCNKCFARPCKEIELDLTSCGHILCSLCKRPNELCIVCNVKCSTISLSNPLPAQVEICVADPVVTLKKLKQVVNLQEKNRLELHFSILKKAETTLFQVERKCQLLYQENCYLKGLLSQYKVPTRTPPPHGLAQQARINNLTSETRQIILETPQSLGLR